MKFVLLKNVPSRSLVLLALLSLVACAEGPNHRLGWYHFASGGESISKIASIYKKDPALVAELNKMEPEQVPRAHVMIYIPPVEDRATLVYVLKDANANPRNVPRIGPNPKQLAALQKKPPTVPATASETTQKNSNQQKSTPSKTPPPPVQTAATSPASTPLSAPEKSPPNTKPAPSKSTTAQAKPTSAAPVGTPTPTSTQSSQLPTSYQPHNSAAANPAAPVAVASAPATATAPTRTSQNVEVPPPPKVGLPPPTTSAAAAPSAPLSAPSQSSKPDPKPSAPAGSPAQQVASPAPIAGPAAEKKSEPPPAAAAPSSTTRRMPFVWPVPGKLSRSFSEEEENAFRGILITAPPSTPVVAARQGRVFYVGELAGYGNAVLIEHENGFLTVYGFVDKPTVRKKQEVREGQQIAVTGKPPGASESQLLFEIRKNARPVNPSLVLP